MKSFYCLILVLSTNLQPLDPIYNNLTNNTISIEHVNRNDYIRLKNDEIYQTFYNYFQSVRNFFEETYCENLQNLYATNGFKIESSFSPLLKNFLNFRCQDKNHCAFRDHWNISNQNHIQFSTYFDYYVSYIYYNFPLFTLIILILCYISLMNCLYLNFCFCGCWIYKIQTGSSIKKMITSIIVTIIIYVVISGFILIRLTSLNESFKEMFCEVVSTTVFMPLLANNITTIDKSQTNSWKGLIQLNSTLTSIHTQIQELGVLFSNKSLDSSGIDNLTKDYDILISEFDFFFDTFITSSPTKSELKIEDTQFNLIFYSKDYDALVRLINESKEELESLVKINEKTITEINELLISYFNENSNEEGSFDLEENLRTEIFKTFKFYNTIDTMYHDYVNYYTIANVLQYIFFITNSIFVILCVILGLKITNALFTNTVNEEKKEKLLKRRWIYHLSINYNLLTSLVYMIFSFILFFLSISLYEGGIVFEEDFFNKYLMSNFSFVANGEFIDKCNKEHYILDLILVNSSFSKLQEINYKVNETKNAFPKFIDSSNDWSKRQKYYELNDTIYNLSSHNFYANKTIDNNIITFQWNELDFAQIWLDPFKETNNNYSLLRKDNPIYYLNDFTDFARRKFVTYCNSSGNYSTMIQNIFVVNNSYSSNSFGKIHNLTEKFQIAVDNNEDTPKFNIKNDLSTVINIYTMCKDINLTEYIEYINYYLENSLEPFALNDTMSKKIINMQETFREKVDALYTTYLNDFNTSANAIIDFWNTASILLDILGSDKDESLNSKTECTFIGNLTRTFEFSKNVFGEEFFGLSILYICLSICLFVNTCLVIVLKMNLRSNKEISIHTALESIKTDLALQEDKFFRNENNFIDDDDQLILDKITNLKSKSSKPLKRTKTVIAPKPEESQCDANKEIEQFEKKIKNFVVEESKKKKEENIEDYLEENEEEENVEEEENENEEEVENDDDIDYENDYESKNCKYEH